MSQPGMICRPAARASEDTDACYIRLLPLHSYALCKGYYAQLSSCSALATNADFDSARCGRSHRAELFVEGQRCLAEAPTRLRRQGPVAWRQFNRRFSRSLCRAPWRRAACSALRLPPPRTQIARRRRRSVRPTVRIDNVGDDESAIRCPAIRRPTRRPSAMTAKMSPRFMRAPPPCCPGTRTLAYSDSMQRGQRVSDIVQRQDEDPVS
jgi:hypothetical protein